MINFPIGFYLAIWSGTGMLLAYFYGRKSKQFKWSEYFALIAAPVIGSLGLSYFYGKEIIYFFITSCLIGFVLEYTIGMAYHKTLNRRLWTYGKYNVGGYSSILVIPMWGVAGIVFWLVANSLGL